MAHDASGEAYRDRGRAVSPVIGVILMVAISVILAVVIGAFVLEIGDQQETAPNASFSTDERVVTLKSDRDPRVGPIMEINTSQVVFTHAGGETLPISQMELRFNGHRDVWGVTPSANALEMSAGTAQDSVDLAPQPDFRRGLGTNQDVELSSGSEWNAVAFNVHRDVPTGTGPNYPNSTKSLYEPGTRDVKAPEANATQEFIFLNQFNATGLGYQCSCAVIYIYENSQAPQSGSNWGETYGWGEQIGQGDESRIVWEASSGGKSQTLVQYTTQHSPTKDGSWD